jgi:hypothetical protein
MDAELYFQLVELIETQSRVIAFLATRLVEQNAITSAENEMLTELTAQRDRIIGNTL